MLPVCGVSGVSGVSVEIEWRRWRWGGQRYGLGVAFDYSERIFICVCCVDGGVGCWRGTKTIGELCLGVIAVTCRPSEE
jgi:hypothetical protein